MKNLILLFLIVFGIGCSDKEPTNIESEKPSDFEVYIESANYTYATISWSESFDPEGETVKYSVYLDDELITSNLIERAFTFSELEPSHGYYGEVVAIDPDGNKTPKEFILNTDGNLPPTAFELYSLTTDNVSANFRWSLSTDPEGEVVVYDIYFEGNLVEENLYSQDYYTIEGLEPLSHYNASVVAKDPQGNTFEVPFEIDTADGIYNGDIVIDCQEAVDNFGSQGYIEITGDLDIIENYNGDDILDLSPMHRIKHVGENLVFKKTKSLENFSGLNIETVGKSLIIKMNSNLVTLHGLESLQEVLGSVEIEFNSLSQISTFNSLQTIGFMLKINSNGITEIAGFDLLEQVEHIYITNNPELESLNAFNQLTDIEDLYIEEHPKLMNFNSFNNVNTIDRLVLVESIVNSFSFTSLSQIGIFELINHDGITNLNGFSSLTTILYGDLYIAANDNLTSLDGLENLSYLSSGRIIEIISNSSLVDFCALQTLISNFTGPYVLIQNNAYNPTLNDLENGNCSL